MPRPIFSALRLAALPLALVTAAVVGTAGAATASEAPQSRNVERLSQMDNYAGYSACWSYVHHDGREYGILGTTTGTSIVRLTDPRNPVEVDFIDGPLSDWREMKQYRNWVYVCSEGAGTGRGIQIISMENPDNPRLVKTYRTGFDTAHTVSIDTTRALLYCNGTSIGMVALALQPMAGATNASPTSPQEVGVFSDYYVHDLHLRGTLGYVSAINDGFESILDLTNPANLSAGAPGVEVKRWNTPANFTHNSWTTKNGDYLIVTEENSGGKPKVYDITGPGTPVLKYTFTDLPAHIGHNVHVKGDTAFVSYYTAGVRLYDITDPTKPVEFAYFDTFQGADGGFDGVWGVAPYFPSGIFITSDISNGLSVFRVDAQYGVVRGTVRASAGGAAVAGAVVHDHTSESEAITAANGTYSLAASVNPAGELEASKFGHQNAQATLSVVNGGSYTQDFVAPLLPTGILRGETRNGATNALLSNTPVTVVDTPLASATGGLGIYSFSSIPVGTYPVRVDRPGYLTALRPATVVQGQTTTLDFAITPAAFYDDAETPGSWTLGDPSDNATTGQWIQAFPLGTSTARVIPGAPRLPDLAGGRGEPLAATNHPAPGGDGVGAPGEVQPPSDNTPDPGTLCFVTGNGTTSNVGEADVDNGKTTLTSPVLNLTGLADPRIAYWRWYSNNAGAAAGEDPFITLLSNDGGVNWTAIDSLFDTRNFWERVEIKVTDHFPTPQSVRLRFVAQDLGAGSVVEAALDDLMFYSGAIVTSVDESTPPAPAVTLGAPRPSPTRRGSDVELALPRTGPVIANLYDVQGRLARTLFAGTLKAGRHTLAWDGSLRNGAKAAAGVYLLRVNAAGEVRTQKIVVVR
ncbi:MAG TPA: choice-of-anchor B family protein [Candidatus Eisenbacteria bacterium]|nr:choice-of-anchor B family protein [Candidatus Eisenbacteria bacterium]